MGAPKTICPPALLLSLYSHVRRPPTPSNNEHSPCTPSPHFRLCTFPCDPTLGFYPRHTCATPLPLPLRL